MNSMLDDAAGSRTHISVTSPLLTVRLRYCVVLGIAFQNWFSFIWAGVGSRFRICGRCTTCSGRRGGDAASAPTC